MSGDLLVKDTLMLFVTIFNVSLHVTYNCRFLRYFLRFFLIYILDIFGVLLSL